MRTERPNPALERTASQPTGSQVQAAFVGGWLAAAQFYRSMNMKTSLILGLILVWSASAHAELRIIGVRVTRDTNSMVHVSISSDDKKEIKKDVTVEQAAGILRDAKGWGSSVVVGIVAHGVRLQEYLPLLKAIADNASLDLAFAEGWKPDGICDNIKKRIEQDTGANTP